MNHYAELNRAEADLSEMAGGSMPDLVEEFYYKAHLFFGTFDSKVHDMCAEAIKPRITPVTKYGRAVFSLLNSEAAQTIANQHDQELSFCLEAELRLQQSLAQIAINEPRPDYLPALITTDKNGKPIGICKQRGEPSLYVWSNTTVNTAEGQVMLPAASFCQIIFQDDYSIASRGNPLSTVRCSPLTIESVSFGRFDTTHFSGNTRREIARESITDEDGNPKLATWLPELMTTSPTKIRDTVYKAMRKQR